jgi:hypothetical protein
MGTGINPLPFTPNPVPMTRYLDFSIDGPNISYRNGNNKMKESVITWNKRYL